MAKNDPDYREIIETASKNGDAFGVKDMPASVLEGRLGEICLSRMKMFPLAYAWPALLTVASTMIDPSQRARSNLYCALVGDVHTGKSQAVEHATQILGCAEPTLMKLFSGSAEQLIRKTSDAKGMARLFAPDELGHLFEKMRIERSSFSFVLNRAYYDDRFEVLMGKKERAVFDCRMSLLGGIVEEKFQELFDASATGGLYDRFIFGLCPTGFRYDYFPFEGEPEQIDPVAVWIDKQVWEAKSMWLKARQSMNPRVVEHAIRAAVVCAAVDGRKVLTVENTLRALEFAEYQHRIRSLLKPNPGENQEAKIALRIIDYVGRSNGNAISKRKLLKAINAYRLGPSNAERALNVLNANGEIAIVRQGKQIFIKSVAEEE